MKVSFVTVATPPYIQYLKVMLHTFMENSGLADPSRPMYIIHHEIGPVKKKELKAICPQVVFVAIDVEKWTALKKRNPKYWSLASFGMVHPAAVDRLIYFDADLVFVKPVTELLEVKVKLGMVHEKRRNCFNAGLMVIDRSVLDRELLDTLLDIHKVRGEFGHDQWIINDFFKGKIDPLPMEFNTLLSELDFLTDRSDAKILHYIYKPDCEERATRIPEWCREIYKEAAAGAERKVASCALLF